MTYINNGQLILNGTYTEETLQNKLNRALELIVEKRVDMGWFVNCESVTEYNAVIGTVAHQLLTEYEFYLIREVTK